MFNEFVIDKGSLLNNILNVKKNNPNSKICIMVKANAYGVGIEEVVSAVRDDVDFFGVANKDEADRVAHLTNKKILIVTPFIRGNVNQRYSYTCDDLDGLNYLISLDLPINIHLKINTGMNRYGTSELAVLKEMLARIRNSKLTLEGVFTHFATADDYVDIQLKKFNEFVSCLRETEVHPIIHADNSAVNRTKNHHFDMVRIGFDVYNQNKDNFQPVVRILSHVIEIRSVNKGSLIGYDRRFVADRDMKVAIVPIGYADGFSTLFIGKDIIIKGEKFRVLNVCMDCLMLDISGADITLYDKIPILDEYNSLQDYSDFSSLSPYEIMVNFGHVRAKRRLIFVSSHRKDK